MQTINISPEQLARLRSLRLWHWERCMKHRELARKHTTNGKRVYAVQENVTANFHMTSVQTLNEYFPLGDYAEHDMQKANAK